MLRTSHPWLLVSCVLLLGGACKKSESSHPASDAGNDSGADAAMQHDAAVADAGLYTYDAAVDDAGDHGDASDALQCRLAHALQFGHAGGFINTSTTASLSSAGTLSIERSSGGGLNPGPAASCTPALPICGSASKVDLSDIARDLADPTVVAAFAGQLSYGAVFPDSGIFQVARDDGKTVTVAPGSCAASDTSCTPTPNSVQRLVDDLSALERDGLASSACANLDGSSDAGTGDAG